MALSTELLSQFAKVTNDETKSKSDTTVYGTIVEQNGVKYVQIDGSDLLTPISSTTNVEDKERVTVMIKNHMATVTGNISSPSARGIEVEATNENIKRIEADYVKTKDLEADYVKTKDLEATNATITNLNTKYANIDFTNIGTAAMEYFYAQSGLVKDVTVGNQTITGELVGVTIRGDRIIGNTVVAEKLVIKGSDGLFYKLNTDGMNVETEQTSENSLNGSIITAKSITATKISVQDLVAFDATIGGFKIEGSSIHSTTKDSVDNTTRGLYLGSDGQMALGDANNFLKYYKDTDGKYKLAISADSFVFSSDGESVAEKINGIQVGGTQLIRWSRSLPTDASLDAADRWRLEANISTYQYNDRFMALKFYETGATETTYKNVYSPVGLLPAGWLGQEVTLSAYVYSPNWSAVDSNVRCAVRLNKGGTSVLNYGARTLIRAGGVLASEANESGTLENGKWARISATFKLTAEELSSGTGVLEDNTHVYVSFSLWKNGDVRLYAPKLEMGNKATDWSPAPDDTDSEFEDVRAQIALTQNQITMEVGAVQVGGANYLLNSGTPVTNSKYAMVDYPLGDPKPTEGKTYTLTIWGELGEDRVYFQPYNSSGTLPLASKLNDNGDGTYSATFTWKNSSSAASVTPTFLRIYQRNNTGTSVSTITRIKLEAGNKATDWTQHPEEFRAGTNVTINKDQFTVTTPEFNVNITSEDGTDKKLRIDKEGVYASYLTSDSLPPKYAGPKTLYVNPDATETQVKGGNYFRSLEQVAGMLNNHWVDGAITINLTGEVYIGTVTFRGIHGGTSITLKGTSASHAKIIGRLNLYYNAIRIIVQYLDIDAPGSAVVVAGRVQCCEFSNCIFRCTAASSTNYYGFAVYIGAYCRVEACEMYDFQRSMRAYEGGVIAGNNNKGNCTVAVSESIMHLRGTQPCANSETWTTSIVAGEVYTNNVTVNQGSHPTAPVVTTTTASYNMANSDTYAGGGWNVYGNNDIYQGYTSGLGEHRGCIWFNNTTIRSALNGKTIKQVTLSLYQMSGVGRNQPVQVSLEGIEMNYSGRSDVPYGKTEYEYGVIGTTLGVNQTTTFTIPTKVVTDLVTGKINGFMLRTGETEVMKNDDNSYNYARFAGETTSTNKPTLTITYANT